MAVSKELHTIFPEPPFDQLDGMRLGELRLYISQWQQESKSGWRRFRLSAANDKVTLTPSVLYGIYSRGGRGVLPWIEVLRFEYILSSNEHQYDLRDHESDVELFRTLAAIIPPGGHIMLGCEQPSHMDTDQALVKGVPPVATPLGATLFKAGFPLVRFFDLPEGGLEGQKKLWAERPMDERMHRVWQHQTLMDLQKFIAMPPESAPAKNCVAQARRFLEANS